MILGVGLLAACGGGGGEADGAADPMPTTAEPTTTTAAEHRIDVYEPIPGGSLHGTPRPPLENTGDDYVAITESLIANLRWISENPDPARISEIYVPGTPNHDARIEVYSRLVREGWRWADEGYHLIEVSLVSATADTASLRIRDSLDVERLVDSAGIQVGDTSSREPEERVSSVVLSRSPEGSWRFADWQQIDQPVVAL